ncbi:hypothetical protein M413DRAFT_148739 [Hebeloma cylindrosporum]|uniref:Uncharacterized protein n=1 Tax=Hebeloma cylindrosporum TaxID=76867 RepID=A0A0C3BXX9_HEBCY|nr:hypothetical protein M413DRAFT_148739 [Hebeloma cylindrosporum h7]
MSMPSQNVAFESNYARKSHHITSSSRWPTFQFANFTVQIIPLSCGSQRGLVKLRLEVGHLTRIFRPSFLGLPRGFRQCLHPFLQIFFLRLVFGDLALCVVLHFCYRPLKLRLGGL